MDSFRYEEFVKFHKIDLIQVTCNLHAYALWQKQHRKNSREDDTFASKRVLYQDKRSAT